MTLTDAKPLLSSVFCIGQHFVTDVKKQEEYKAVANAFVVTLTDFIALGKCQSGHLPNEPIAGVVGST
ncbi:hypothetical protein GCM10028819_24420 [Spirosoma humi]